MTYTSRPGVGLAAIFQPEATATFAEVGWRVFSEVLTGHYPTLPSAEQAIATARHRAELWTAKFPVQIPYTLDPRLSSPSVGLSVVWPKATPALRPPASLGLSPEAVMLCVGEKDIAVGSPVMDMEFFRELVEKLTEVLHPTWVVVDSGARLGLGTKKAKVDLDSSWLAYRAGQREFVRRGAYPAAPRELAPPKDRGLAAGAVLVAIPSPEPGRLVTISSGDLQSFALPDGQMCSGSELATVSRDETDPLSAGLSQAEFQETLRKVGGHRTEILFIPRWEA